MKFSEWQNTAHPNLVAVVMESIDPATRRFGDAPRMLPGSAAARFAVLRAILNDGIEPEMLSFDWRTLTTLQREIDTVLARTKPPPKPFHPQSRAATAKHLMMNWAEENCAKRCVHLYLSLWVFEDVKDAILFKLRFW